MDQLVLYNGYKKILDNIYDPKKIYERSHEFISNYGFHRAENPIQKNFTFNDLVALFKIICFAGVLGKGRLYFWRLMIGTFFTNKKNIIHALLFGALLFQFQKLQDKFMISYEEISSQSFEYAKVKG